MLAAGRILKSYGTDGGLLVSPAVDLETLEKEEPVFIEFDGLQVPFFILDVTPKGNRCIVHLTDISSLEEADEVVGRDILADVAEEDEGPDFTGWTVYDVAGMPDQVGHDGKGRPRKLGVVTGDEPIPGNYCIYVGDILIPLHEDFIVSADPKRRELILDLPAGLY